LRAQGIRIYGPGATAAQDLEPESITVNQSGTTAYVTLQENNAVAVVDIASAKVLSIRPLGFKNHNLAGMGLDASDEDGGTNTNSGTPAIKIAPYPVKGLYLPDAIASYNFNGEVYLVTANEGDARADWPGFNEETRVRAHCDKGLDPTVFSDAANLILDSNLGRLRITATPNGGSAGKNAAGQCNELFSFGARSFSIWNSSFNRVFDSGDQFEQRTQALANVKFNASHDNDTLDGRSASKGPEPEGVVLGKIGDKTFAFIGLERVGGVMVYDITNPVSPTFVTYFNPRSGATGDRGPEGLAFIPAGKSPNGKPLLILGHEVSGTTTVLQLNLSF
jgi:DNA-binding beta-propeller fold protein YncE